MDKAEHSQMASDPRKLDEDRMSQGLSHSSGCSGAAIDFAFNDKVVLDTRTKQVAQKFSLSVVSLQYSTGGKEIYGSGTIIESGRDERGCFASVLTSAHFILSTESSSDTIKISVRLPNGDIGSGSLRCLDPHYNIALVDVQCKVVLTIANLKPVDDSLDILSENRSSFHCSNSMFHRVYPGDKVMILGRAYEEPPYQAIAFSGEFCIDSCRHDCKELLRLNGMIFPPFVGGSVINTTGEVIGIAYYNKLFTSFLPSNVILRWLDATKNKRPFHRPNLGMEFSNLATTRLCRLDKLTQFKGIIVEFVTPQSVAALAGLQRHDAIIECDGETVLGNLQFFDMIHEKVGNKVVLKVLRIDEGSTLFLDFTPEDTEPCDFNRWLSLDLNPKNYQLREGLYKLTGVNKMGNCVPSKKLSEVPAVKPVRKRNEWSMNLPHCGDREVVYKVKGFSTTVVPLKSLRRRDKGTVEKGAAAHGGSS